MSNDPALVSKVWNFAHVLRDDGVGYGDYLEQITYLLFLKMADELSRPPYNKSLSFPRLKDIEGNEIEDADRCDWQTLIKKRLRAGSLLHTDAALAGHGKGNPGPDFHQESEQDSGSVEAAQGCRPDRQRAVDHGWRGRKG